MLKVVVLSLVLSDYYQIQCFPISPCIEEQSDESVTVPKHSLLQEELEIDTELQNREDDHEIINEHAPQRLCDNPIIIQCNSKECPQIAYIVPKQVLNIDSSDQSMNELKEQQLVESARNGGTSEEQLVRYNSDMNNNLNNDQHHISNNDNSNFDDTSFFDPFSFISKINRNSRSTSSFSSSDLTNDEEKNKQLRAKERRNRMFEGLLKFTTILNRVDTYFTDKAKSLIRGLNKMVESEEDDEYFH